MARDRAGRWHGQDVEAVYHPRQHDVLLVQGPASDEAQADLQATGWEFAGTDGRSWLLVRDRVAATEMALNRAPKPPGLELGGPGL